MDELRNLEKHIIQSGQVKKVQENSFMFGENYVQGVLVKKEITFHIHQIMV